MYLRYCHIVVQDSGELQVGLEFMAIFLPILLPQPPEY